jgi:hypothetical protein
MTMTFPVVSLSTMKQLFPENKTEAESIASSGLWFYSVPDSQFLSYIPDVNICVNDADLPGMALEADEVSFRIRRYGSIYEVTREGFFASSFLTAANLQQLTEEYLDVTDDLFVAVLNSITAPIMLGSEKALKRLLVASDEDSYKLAPLSLFIQERK